MRGDLQVQPASGPASAVLHITGHVPSGSAGVRLLWHQGAQALGYIEGPVTGEGAFDLTISVPANAFPGPATLHSVPTETLNGPIDAVPFQVLPTANGTVTGTVNVPAPGSVPPFHPPAAGTKVCLKDLYGQIVACTTTDENGGWTLTVPPGIYTVQSEAQGTDEPEVTVDPGTTTPVSIKPLAGTTENVCDPKFFSPISNSNLKVWED